MEPLAPHERVYVDSEFAEDENHGQMGCEECHGGNPSDPNWRTAHEGVVKDPSCPDPSETCGECHNEIAETFKSSLHMTLAPYKKMIDMRANPDESVHAKVEAAREFHCSSCHSSCGQCHVSRPESVNGGLLEAHQFQKRPPMHTVCTACHGSRIEKEYLGKNEGIPPDIHKEKHFKCGKCHKAEEMHGDGIAYANRYDVKNGPTCVACHEEIYKDSSKNAKQHNNHKDKLSCQVCHSMPYKNCYTCHVGKDDQSRKYYKTKGSMLDFKIGFNPMQSEKRPEKYVLLRHVPVDQNSFKFYVKNGLSKFHALPTWKLTTPHNIRRQTPQNKTCNNCHGNAALFLSEKDVKAAYLEANKRVIVPSELIPEKVENLRARSTR